MNFYLDAYVRGKYIYLKEISNGVRKKHKIEYAPYLFVPAKDGTYSSIHGTKLAKYDFVDMNDGNEFISKYEDIENFNFYGMTQWLYPFLNDTYSGIVDYDTKYINRVTLDIEVGSEKDKNKGFPHVFDHDQEVTVITMSMNGTYYVIGMKDFDKSKVQLKNPDHKIVYYQCENEYELLRKFVDVWERLDIDVVTGWNVEMFDLPYLYKRIKKIVGDAIISRLSPWGNVWESSVTFGDKQEFVIYISGINVVDYQRVIKKFYGKTLESYKLDFVAWTILKEKKLDHNEYSTFPEFYEKDYQKYVAYNIKDVELVDRIEEETLLLELVYAITYDAKILILDSFTTVRMWDVIIHNYLLNEKNIAVSQYSPSSTKAHYAGGYVKDPQVGAHDWVVSFDLNSLYPHLIRQYNISPEKFVDKMYGYGVDDAFTGELYNTTSLEEKNCTIAPNGCIYSREGQGFLPYLMEEKYNDRSKYKKLMIAEQQKYEETKNVDHKRKATQYEKIQLAKKIQLNAAYGALANQYFRWFDINLAEAITLGGQLSIRWVERDLNIFMNKILSTDNVDYVIAIDTDSVYLNFGPFMKKFPHLKTVEDKVNFIDKTCEDAFQKVINNSYAKLAKYSNAFEQQMHMKRESIASRGIWTGKKRYALLVWDNEGVRYSEPEVKITGIEAVRSSTPEVCRDEIKANMRLMLEDRKEELIDEIEKFKNKFYSMPYDAIAFPRGMNNINKYFDSASLYKKGTPVHVRGAIVYNNFIKNNKLDDTLETIRDGDKVKFCYMMLPNKMKENILTTPGLLPKELGMEAYIDYETQFYKAFLSPIESISKVLGWELEKKATVEAFFA